MVLATATTQATQTDTASATALTTTLTFVTRGYQTATVTTTTTVTVTPTPVSLACQGVPSSYIQETFAGIPQVLHADVQNGMSGIYGSAQWVANATATGGPDRRRFHIDASGNVNFRTSSLVTTLYINTASAGNTLSVRPQLILESQFDYYVGIGQPYARLKGCADPATGELLLTIAGRTNILYCSGQFWMSSGSGSDTGLSCVRAFPKLVVA